MAAGRWRAWQEGAEDAALRLYAIHSLPGPHFEATHRPARKTLFSCPSRNESGLNGGTRTSARSSGVAALSRSSNASACAASDGRNLSGIHSPMM
jgi:hypothetical protein